MDRRMRFRSHHRAPLSRASFVTLLSAAVLIAGLLPVATAQPVRTLRIVPAATDGIQATVTWDGTNIAHSPQPSSAITTTLGGPVDLLYNWSSSVEVGGSPLLYTINDARLQMFYFGFALSSRDVLVNDSIPTVAGSISMDWVPPSVLHYVIEGTFLLTASLLAPNGTTMWSQNFYVDASAPLSIGAVVPVILVLIGLYEVYALLTSGRQDRPRTPSVKAWSAGSSSKPSPEPKGDAPVEGSEASRGKGGK